MVCTLHKRARYAESAAFGGIAQGLEKTNAMPGHEQAAEQAPFHSGGENVRLAVLGSALECARQAIADFCKRHSDCAIMAHHMLERSGCNDLPHTYPAVHIRRHISGLIPAHACGSCTPQHPCAQVAASTRALSLVRLEPCA